MKTKTDPRHITRRKIVKELFAESFTSQKSHSQGVYDIIAKLSELDARIKDSAPAWPVEKLNKIDLAILRLAVFELLYETKTPPKVVIDEAVELAKEFGTETSGSFVNGTLGSVYDKIKKANKMEE